MLPGRTSTDCKAEYEADLKYLSEDEEKVKPVMDDNIASMKFLNKFTTKDLGFKPYEDSLGKIPEITRTTTTDTMNFCKMSKCFSQINSKEFI